MFLSRNLLNPGVVQCRTMYCNCSRWNLFCTVSGVFLVLGKKHECWCGDAHIEFEDENQKKLSQVYTQWSNSYIISVLVLYQLLLCFAFSIVRRPGLSKFAQWYCSVIQKCWVYHSLGVVDLHEMFCFSLTPSR